MSVRKVSGKMVPVKKNPRKSSHQKKGPLRGKFPWEMVPVKTAPARPFPTVRCMWDRGVSVEHLLVSVESSTGINCSTSLGKIFGHSLNRKRFEIIFPGTFYPVTFFCRGPSFVELFFGDFFRVPYGTFGVIVIPVAFDFEFLNFSFVEISSSLQVLKNGLWYAPFSSLKYKEIRLYSSHFGANRKEWAQKKTRGHAGPKCSIWDKKERCFVYGSFCSYCYS